MKHLVALKEKITQNYPVTPQVLLQKVTGLPTPYLPVLPDTSECWGTPLGNWIAPLKYKLQVAAAWEKVSLIISTLTVSKLGCSVFLLPALED